MAGFRRRYVWIVTSPKGRMRVFGTKDAMEEAIPQSYRNHPREESATKWTFGKTKSKQFVAVRLPIEDSDALPR